ncbi:DUF1573 domain-containing protein [Candidatus Gracilibacteria bacterium]|nr:DUF1573 domain-containing protein [Candidatus Gracilibacteria bacterium]
MHKKHCCHSHSFFFWAVLFLFIVGAWGIGVKYQEVQQNAKNKQEISENAPRLIWEDAFFDWGEVPRDEKSYHSFLIQNTGKSPLIISKIRTSCGCTTAEIIQDEVLQPIPSSIAPDTSAEVRVTFDPEVMDSRGDVARAVRIETNDPRTPFLVFNLTAHVR